MSESSGFIDKITQNYTPKVNKSVDVMTPNEATALAITSIFDKPKGKEDIDGKIDKEEVGQISKEEYEKQIAAMREEFGKDKGKEVIKDMKIPTYDELKELSKDKPLSCGNLLSVIREKNPQINENIFRQKINAGINIVQLFGIEDKDESQKVLNYILSGKDKDFNSSCKEVDELFEKYDQDKNGIFSVDEQNEYLKRNNIKNDKNQQEKSDLEKSDLILQLYLQKKTIQGDTPEDDSEKPTINNGDIFSS